MTKLHRDGSFTRYRGDLKALTALVRHESEGFTIQDLANASGLCWSTVDRFLSNETRYPRHYTVVRIAWAVGVNLQPIQRAKRHRRVG